MAVKVLSILFSRWGRRIIGGAASAGLTVAGEAHMMKLGFTFASFSDSFREYSLLCVAGALFGWLLKDAGAAYIRDFFVKPSKTLFPWPATGWIAASVLFVMVLHQFRYFLNDGPANITMAFGLLANLMVAETVSAGPPDAPPHGGDGSFAGLGEQYDRAPYSPAVFSRIAAAHAKAGNRFKAALAGEMAAGLGK